MLTFKTDPGSPIDTLTDCADLLHLFADFFANVNAVDCRCHLDAHARVTKNLLSPFDHMKIVFAKPKFAHQYVEAHNIHP